MEPEQTMNFEMVVFVVKGIKTLVANEIFMENFPVHFYPFCKGFLLVCATSSISRPSLVTRNDEVLL